MTTATKKNPARDALQMRERQATAAARMGALAKILDDRDHTPAEAAEFTAIKARVEMMRDVQGGLMETAANLLDDAMGAPSADTGGFDGLGDFAASVARNSRLMPGTIATAGDPRLMPLAAAPSTYGNESSGADGGFLVPPALAQSIVAISWGGDNLLPLCSPQQIGGNSLTLPLDQSTPWGNTGIQAYWTGEAGAIPQSKPLLKTAEVRLKKLAALVPVTEELLADAPAMADYVPVKMGEAVSWKVSAGIMRGNGAGQPLGIIGSGGVVSVAKDAGQIAGTLSATNLANMVSRLPPGSYTRSVWLISPDTLPALWTLTLGNTPIYAGPSADEAGFRAAPYGRLLGRPVIATQHAAPFSSAGDVMLMDFQYYSAITKAAGMRLATSMHMFFDADVMAFRLTFRFDGLPAITAPITPANGSTATLSPFVVLGAR